jgi:diguanylate cyclase (GGDEF)-like protein
MSELVDHLADLTGFRDRDVLDTTLASALRDLVRPLGVVIYRSVGPVGDERWLTRARLMAGDVAPSVDSDWIDLERLPAVSSSPERLECLLEAVVCEVPGAPHTTIFPMTTDREVVGTIDVLSDEPLSVAQRRTIESVLRIYRNFQAVLDYSERDTLTGLLNRKTFDETFHKVVLAAGIGSSAEDRRNAGAPARTWLSVIDIDHFKQVNDRHGHLIGDEVLLLMARLMRSTFRYQDRLYRFGGEEFVVMMRCPGEAEARSALERFRANVERYAFPQVGRVTVSLGFTEVLPGDAPSGAFERADRAVYQAKQSGRNRVVGHEDLVASGKAPADKHGGGDVELF